MDKNRFTTILKHYTRTSPEEARELAELRDAYPYSQVLHVLSARAGKDHNMDGHASWLPAAAVHVTDRAVLRDIMTAVALPEITEQQDDAVIEERIQPIKSVEEPDIDYAEELMRDLKILNTLKHNFEMLLVEYSEVHATTPPAIDSGRQETPAKKKTPPRLSGPKKSKKQRIIEMAQAMNQKNDHELPSTKGKKKGPHKSADPPDALIEEIETNKRELHPETEKQLEQLNLINQFIKTQPSISSARDRVPPPAGDLNPIKSGEFGDNIVSETLVEILVRQGKKDKAIEVLKKLIWKYPQKKTYFASQIEELKK